MKRVGVRAMVAALGCSAFVGTVGTVVMAGPAAAQPAAHLSTHVPAATLRAAAHHHHHRHPLCRGLRHAHRTHERMLTAATGADSPLGRGITRLICSAATGATIDIKSMFIIAGGSTFMRRLATDLYLMHHYRRVQVNLLVDRSYYFHHHPRQWWQFRHMFAFARIGWCPGACHSQHAGAKSHSKWITVSRLAARLGGGPAVLSTSANFSTQQLGARNSGILVLRNRPLYRAFVHEWASDEACHHRRNCSRPKRAATWRGSHGARVYFTPVSDDPIVDLLGRLTCKPGSRISVLSMGIQQPMFIRALNLLEHNGCQVRALLNPKHGSQADKATHAARCQPVQHDKAIIIDAGGVHTVIAGSLDFNYVAEHANDNQMIRTSKRSVVHAYQAYFDRGWQHGTSCSHGH